MLKSDEVLSKLFEKLWQQYYSRVTYAKTYVDAINEAGGTVVNDHIALRTFNCVTGNQAPGIEAMRPIFESLGYVQKGEYAFKVKKLSAVHFEHANKMLPKVFVSQLEVDQLSEKSQEAILKNVGDAPNTLVGKTLDLLNKAKKDGGLEAKEADELVDALYGHFDRPWSPPFEKDVLAVNEESQYAAWTLLHGNSVNHFTAFINHQNHPMWKDIEDTVAGLNALGVPTKDNIEGEKGSKLRQSSTKAVMEDCEVKADDGSIKKLEWSYAYYELAERSTILVDGKEVEFTGFLGEQATHLFEMTKK